MNIGFGNLKKEKTPLEKCKSLDGKIFYSEDEIPENPTLIVSVKL